MLFNSAEAFGTIAIILLREISKYSDWVLTLEKIFKQAFWFFINIYI